MCGIQLEKAYTKYTCMGHENIDIAQSLCD